jgi:peptidylprolyl isomerase
MSTSSDNKRERKFRGKKSRVHRTRLLATAVVILLVVSLVTVYVLKPGNQSAVDSNRVLLVTSMGNITIQLYDDMPITTGNFKNLTIEGVYDGTIFHRVVQDFVIQGGDASTKGIVVPQIPDELPNKHNNTRGSVAMAKTDQPNSATSQFFINVKDNLDLDSNYSVFGTVISGMEVVDTISNVSVDSNDRPLEDVTILIAVLVE